MAFGSGEVFKLFGSIGVETSGVDKGIEDAVGTASTGADKIKGYFTNAAKTIGGLFAAGKLIDLGKESIEAAATAKAISSQFEQVFGDMQSGAQTSIDNLSKQFGMLPNRIKPAFTAATSQFRGLGLSVDAAMTQAEIKTTAAADAAAFYDVSFEDASSSLNSFIKGNYEGGESIGIFGNETQLATWAANNLGLKWSELGEADKQIARLKFATTMQEAAGATGQAARESDGYENQMGNVKQAWEDFKAGLGGPVLDKAVGALQGLSGALSWVTDNLNWIIPVAGAFLGLVGAMKVIGFINGLMTTWTTATNIAAGAQQALNFVMSANHIGIVIVLIAALVAGLVWFFTQTESGRKVIKIFGDGIMDVFKSIGDFFSSVFGGISDGIGQIGRRFGDLGNRIADVFNGAKNFVGGIVDWFKNVFNFSWKLPHIDLPHFSLSGSINPLDWFSQGLPKIGVEWYAKGGIMSQPTIFGSSGSNLLAGGEAGPEAVLPLNARNLAGIGEGIAQSSGSADALSRIITLLETLLTLLGSGERIHIEITNDGSPVDLIKAEMQLEALLGG